MSIPDRSTFENIYAGQPRWEIGRPQKAFIDIADQITGSILDSGCGTGENAFFFASRGHKVTGIDFLAEPITIAKQKDTASRSSLLAVLFGANCYRIVTGSLPLRLPHGEPFRRKSFRCLITEGGT